MYMKKVCGTTKTVNPITDSSNISKAETESMEDNGNQRLQLLLSNSGLMAPIPQKHHSK